MSEIDDIFSSKGKGKNLALSLKTPSAPAPSLKKDKKKKRKRSDTIVEDEALNSSAVVSSSTKRLLPETVIDTSHCLSGPSKRQKGEKSRDEPKVSMPAKGGVKKLNDDVAFKDSRGTSDRRKTEEGWLVYKEDELGIGDEGGDTPLCPFDCDCCF